MTRLLLIVVLLASLAACGGKSMLQRELDLCSKIRNEDLRVECITKVVQ